MFILEGVNFVGKTTLANAILNYDERYSYMHFSRPKPGVPPFEYFSRPIANAHRHMVLDRFHWSAVAYENDPQLTRQEFVVLEMMLAVLDTTLIYCHCHKNRLKERHKVLASNKSSSQAIEKVSYYYDRFESLWNGELCPGPSPINFACFCSDDYISSEEIETELRIKRFLDRLRDERFKIKDKLICQEGGPENGIGNLSPSAVIFLDHKSCLIDKSEPLKDLPLPWMRTDFAKSMLDRLIDLRLWDDVFITTTRDFRSKAESLSSKILELGKMPKIFIQSDAIRRINPADVEIIPTEIFEFDNSLSALEKI